MSLLQGNVSVLEDKTETSLKSLSKELLKESKEKNNLQAFSQGNKVLNVIFFYFLKYIFLLKFLIIRSLQRKGNKKLP